MWVYRITFFCSIRFEIKVSFQILKKECNDNPDLRNCSCLLYYLRPIDEGHALAPMYSINCSNRNLYNLPATVPVNTTIFYAKSNQVSACLNTPRIHKYHHDHNTITSIFIPDLKYWFAKNGIWACAWRLSRLQWDSIDRYAWIWLLAAEFSCF